MGDRFRRRAARIGAVAVIGPILLASCAERQVATSAGAASGATPSSATSSAGTQSDTSSIKGGLSKFEATASPAPVDNTPPGGGTSVSDAVSAVAIAKSDTAEFGKSTVVGSKLMSFGSLIGPGHVMSDVTSPPAGFSTSQMVWVVTFSGSYHPEFARTSDPNLGWGAMIIDSKTGAILGTFAGQNPVPVVLTDQ